MLDVIILVEIRVIRNVPFWRYWFSLLPIPVAARSKALVCGRSLSGIVGSNPAGPWMFFSCECCQIEVSASD